MRQFTVGSLFAGIGGFDLGFERAGFKTVWQVEINEYCRKVLEIHFPDAKRYSDIRNCCGLNCTDPGRWRDGEPPCFRDHLRPVDVICGGFPCQDISNAGLRAGIDGERSGLWREMHRVISELRPRFVVVENVAALLGRGMGTVLGDLAEIGYDAEWQSISAAAVGAPHIRERIWILAYPGQEPGTDEGRNYGIGRCDYLSPQRDAWQEEERCPDWQLPPLVQGIHQRMAADWWLRQSSVARTTHGIRGRLDERNGALGNAVVPQIPELIARRLKEVLAV